MMVAHECRECFRKIISQPQKSKDPKGNFSFVVDSYCSKCTDEDPLKGLLVVEVMKIFDNDHVHGFQPVPA